MTVWEGEITACEQRILITVLVSKDLDNFMESDIENMRSVSFEPNGCLITVLPNDLHNSKINSQGMPVGSLIVPKVSENSEENALARGCGICCKRGGITNYK